MDKIQIPNEPFKKIHKPVNEMVKRGEVDEKEIRKLKTTVNVEVVERMPVFKKEGK